MVERQLPKLNVAGSIPVSRSTIQYLEHSGFDETVSYTNPWICHAAPRKG